MVLIAKGGMRPRCRKRTSVKPAAVTVDSTRQVAGAATQRPNIRLFRAAASFGNDVFDLEGPIEDGLRGTAVFATIPGPLRHDGVARIHSWRSASKAAARRPDARTSASTKASNSACSLGGKESAASRAARHPKPVGRSRGPAERRPLGGNDLRTKARWKWR